MNKPEPHWERCWVTKFIYNDNKCSCIVVEPLHASSNRGYRWWLISNRNMEWETVWPEDEIDTNSLIFYIGGVSVEDLRLDGFKI